jgi:hypothetical protein
VPVVFLGGELVVALSPLDGRRGGAEEIYVQQEEEDEEDFSLSRYVANKGFILLLLLFPIVDRRPSSYIP